jgi:hypothetical protein
MEERKRGQAWGTLMPDSWFTYATPPVETPRMNPEEQVPG